ncbi:MAG: protein kinase, partial [Chloroflexi bacterium]|nr:protein kinase [Chloroflexota bacterium]
SPTHVVRPLNARSVLGKLLQLAREEIFPDVDASGPVGRLLPKEDKRWLNDYGFELLLPLTGSAGHLLGIIAVGQKRSQTSFSAHDRMLLGTFASQAAVMVENLALRDPPFRYLGGARRPRAHTIDWDDEPGSLCPSCHKMWPPRHTTCECGAPTASTAVPLLIRGKFRVERLIGSGGMSLVYLATDLTLGRRVAIKALPRLTRDRILRLEREARAMAAISPHPNLAMILGTEDWREVPLLIVEYLEGGTLADRLRQEQPAVDDVIDLGIALADALDHVHVAGVLHRDIKPTNIGYTREGVPKLLDFGVAMMLHPTASPATWEYPVVDRPHQAAKRTDHASTATSLTTVDHVAGTLLYLSPEAFGRCQ